MLFVIGIVIGLRSAYKNEITAEGLRAFLLGYGVYAPAAYIITISIASNLFAPMSILIITGGLLFGARDGFLYSYAGATLSVSLGYVLYRNLSVPYTKSLPDNMVKFLKKLQSRGLAAALIIRLISMPFAAQNLIGSTMNIPFRSYFIGSLIGMTPWLIGFSFFGSSLMKMQYHLIGLSVLALGALSWIAVRLTRTGEARSSAALTGT